jgi:UDP:flavonoid glycosyltransferase YjiC (YdhE family)
VPTGTRRSRLEASVGWKRFLVRERIRRRAEKWWVAGSDWHTMLAGLGARADLGEATVSRRYLQYYDYLELPRIRTVAPELAFPGEPQPPFVVGPIVDPEREVHQPDAQFEERWAAVLQRRASGARVVYVSVGTFLSGMESLTEQVIEAARLVPRTEVVVSVGRDRDRWSSVELPENVVVFGRVPQTLVLADADVVVSTGGLNTGHEALWFGVPVLNLPIAGLDTPGNSARLAYHRVGRRLTPRQISVDGIREELTVLLDDPGYRQRATEIGDQLRRWDGRTRAVEVIEAHLGRN